MSDIINLIDFIKHNLPTTCLKNKKKNRKKMCVKSCRPNTTKKRICLPVYYLVFHKTKPLIKDFVAKKWVQQESIASTQTQMFVKAFNRIREKLLEKPIQLTSNLKQNFRKQQRDGFVHQIKNVYVEN